MSRENKCYQTEDGPVWGSRSVAVVHLVMCLERETGRPRILLTKRSDTMTDAPGKWCIPCGYLDWDETVEEAATREVLQETGLDVSKISEIDVVEKLVLVGVDSNPLSNRQNVTLRFITMFEPTEYPTLTPCTTECSEAVWMTGQEVAKIKNDFAFNHYELLIQMIHEGLTKRF